MRIAIDVLTAGISAFASFIMLYSALAMRPAYFQTHEPIIGVLCIVCLLGTGIYAGIAAYLITRN